MSETCLFCDNPRMKMSGCRKKTHSVCERHFMIECPECGHEAFWLENTKTGKAYYHCFRIEPWCNWISERP